MNTAQQVRMWVGVGIGVLLAISVFGMVGSLTSVTNFNGTGNTALFTTNGGAFYAWLALAIVCLVAEGILAGFSIYRGYNPIRKPVDQQAASVAVPSQSASADAQKPPTDAVGLREQGRS
jgi:hypothetical protein